MLAIELGRGIIKTVTVSRARTVDVLVANKFDDSVGTEEEEVESETGEEGVANGVDVA